MSEAPDLLIPFTEQDRAATDARLSQTADELADAKEATKAAQVEQKQAQEEFNRALKAWKLGHPEARR